jgi:hypothetical protein
MSEPTILSPNAASRAPQPTENGKSGPCQTGEAITSRELNLVKALRLLQTIHPAAFNELEDQLWASIACHLKWSDDDPESLQLAADFMALDPQMRRESDAISAEFSVAISDGLEAY